MILYLICEALLVFITYKYMEIFLGKVKINKKLELLLYFTYFISLVFFQKVIKNPMINFVMNIIYIFAMALIREGRIFSKIFTVLINMAISVILEIIFYKFILENLHNPNIFEIAFFGTIVTNMIIVYLLQYTVKPKNNKLPFRYKFVFIVFLSTSLIYIIFNTYNIINSKSEIDQIQFIVMTVLNVLVIYLYEGISNYVEKEIELKSYKSREESYLRQIDQIQKSEEKQNKIRHDMKKSLKILKLMLDNKDYSSLENSLKTMESELFQEGRVNSGNIYIDSILNYEINRFEEMGVKVKDKVFFIGDLKDKNYDIIIILQNLLENAYEALSNIENTELYIFMENYRGELNITIENNFKHKLKILEGKIITTKTDNLNHGYGLKIVKEKVEKLGGILKINIEKDKFISNITIRP